MHRSVYVIGGAHSPFIGKFHPDFIWKKHPDFGKRDNPTLIEHLHTAILGALDNAAVPAAAVDRGYVGNFAGELFSNQGHLGSAAAAAHPDLDGKPFARLEGACASGGLALLGAVDAIQAGCDVVLVAGAEVQTTVNAKVGADYLARASHYDVQRGYDPFTFPALISRHTKAHFAAYGTTHEDLGHVAVKAYGNANRNPDAHMKARKIDFDWARAASDYNPLFLENEEVREYLKLSDCSQVSDGGSALIVVSEDGLKRIGRSADDAVRLTACQASVGALGDPKDLTWLDTTARAAKLAYAEAGVAAGDVGVAEVHDCFTIAEIMMTEALGFADRGEGAALARDGATAIDGSIPVNTGGGLIGFGHPVGATGVKQVLELFRQMRGECGDYQVPGDPKVGISSNMGGDDRTAVVTILQS